MITVVTLLAALYLVWIGTIMKATNGGHFAQFVFKVVPVALGFMLSIPVLKNYL